MFKENDIIRRITEDGTGEIVRVLDIDRALVHIAIGKNGNSEWQDAIDYELVSGDQDIQIPIAIVPNVSDKTQESIHEDISKMYVQAVQFLQANLDGENVELEISGTTNRDSIDVSFKCRIGYESWVESSNLFKSAQVALDRYKEDKGLKPLSIPLYKDAAE